MSSYGESVEQASFVLPKNLGYSLKMNGSQISYNNNEILKTSGSYTMTVYAKNYGITNEYARVYKTDFNFIIENTPTVSDVIDAVKTGVSDAGSGSSDAAEAVVETTTENIVDDSLSETYNSDANLYKETFSNGEGFYANIANGDLSGGNVYIDIPSNMTVTMTKDGIEDQFVNKKYINTEGTYILNITSSSDGVKYKAKFSFRVQKGIEASADAVIDDGIGDESEDDDTAAVFDEDYVYEALTSSSIINEFDNENNLYVFTVGTEKFYANMPAGMFANSSLSLTMPAGLDYSVNKDGEEYENDNDNPDLYEESGSYTFFVSDKYGNSLEADFYLYSNPVNSFESYNAPGGYSITDLTYSDYRDNYGFDPDSDTVKFLEDTSEDEPEVDQDNGGTGESADTDETAADAEDGGDTESEDEDEDVKAGAEIINTQIKKASKKGLDTLVMPLDGRYTIELRGDGLPALQTEIVVDTIAPVVDFQGLKANMKSTGNEVYLSCDDDETTLHLYSKSGTDKILGDAGGSATITGVGEYTLIAVDKAGNQSEYTFKITRHIGAAGVGAIVLVLLIIIGVCVYMFYNSKKFSVR
ncbi:MAG: hypothetical protein LUC92_08765 [Clostridiales bacterium]|nr:hypothetical protein [Clostridiales bacterium]